MISLMLIVITLSVILVVDKRKLSAREDEMADLKDQNETLEKKVSDLQEEKDDLEKKVADLSEVNRRSYPPNISIPNASRGATITGNGIATVVYKPSDCDYFILENASGYIVAEWMGGHDPDVGDKVSGDFHSFGTKDFFDQSWDSDCRFWIDDYTLSKESALEQMREHCH